MSCGQPMSSGGASEFDPRSNRVVISQHIRVKDPATLRAAMQDRRVRDQIAHDLRACPFRPLSDLDPRAARCSDCHGEIGPGDSCFCPPERNLDRIVHIAQIVLLVGLSLGASISTILLVIALHEHAL